MPTPTTQLTLNKKTKKKLLHNNAPKYSEKEY